MKILTKSEVEFCITALENCSKDMLAEVEGLRSEGLNAWAAATVTRAEGYQIVASKLKEAITDGNKRIGIQY